MPSSVDTRSLFLEISGALTDTSLLRDVDVIVGEDAQAVHQQLLAGDGNFSLSAANKLVFHLEDQDIDIEVELLRGGKDQPMKLPDINTAAILQRNPREIEGCRVDSLMPFLHPGILTLTKLKRWMHIADSTRPASMSRAADDMSDMKTILEWLVSHSLKVNFEMYPEKSKEELLPGMAKLLERGDTEIAGLLKETLFPEDFEALS
ncbi:hypothetical protein McanMca71_000818 [Microsporum canis]|uniref:Uncharacterized protein n=1 Tax=Arthroderma otae (strain ATCC MYA-4605 / CBS 113480) TaxID=554155 RepID=C5FIP6_ARTOC|nr:uncharacterized protein MCYG_01956 [Microsporum canis CBS 113480]EEQ29137.1 predicted protein [Microsporum canis CBS 113480]